MTLLKNNSNLCYEGLWIPKKRPEAAFPLIQVILYFKNDLT